MLDVYLHALDERAGAAFRPAPGAVPTALGGPTGKRPLAPAANRDQVNAFFMKGR